MWLSRRWIILVIGIAATAMIGLLWVQVNLINKDITVYRERFNTIIPDLLMELKSEIRHDREVVKKLRNYKGEIEFFVTSNDISHDDPLVEEARQRLENILLNKNLKIDYEMKGIVADNTPCQYHHYDSHMNMTTLKDIGTKNHLVCLCGPERTAFDFTINYPNKVGSVILVSNPLMITSFTLIGLIIGCFAYIVYVVNRQKRLSEMKNDFVNNLTHEFKTPIFSIDLASGMLKKSKEVKNSNRLSKYVGVIETEGKRLKSQVDKVLQVALVDSGNFKLEKKELDLHDLLFTVSKNFELLIKERGGTLNLKLHASNPRLYADETHLKNIIYNLMDNAQKYTEGAPEIEVTTSERSDGLVLSIRDNGIGISEEVQKFIFDKFYRAKSHNIPDIKGFGLGLSYVKSVVDAHKGKINLESSPNHGSIFTVQFPVA